MKNLILAILATPIIAASTAFGGGNYSGLPEFTFIATDRPLSGPVDTSFDPAAALKECQRAVNEQENLTQKLGFTLVDEVACAIRKTPYGTFVEGSFKLLK